MISEQLQIKIDRAIKLLRTTCKDEVTEIAYSGGKDSDVILQLAKEANLNYRAIYKNTTIDPPRTISHVKAMGAEIVRPKMTFLQIIEASGYPNRFKRVCCGVLKEGRYSKDIHHVVIGVRKAESSKRNKLYNEPTMCKGSKANPYEAVYPLLDWTDEDVHDYIVDRNIRLAPHYYDEQGNLHTERRLGCMCCPLKYYKARIADFKQYPNMVKAYIKAGQKYLDNHADSKQISKYANVYEWFCRELFFQRQSDFIKSKETMFGEDVDYRQFLENYFKIKL